ncbi:MAG: Uma2 family endonuclease [Myxococcales bacterium]|nr:Uma2 family endonuclease [Myxococcales bacterium]
MARAALPLPMTFAEYLAFEARSEQKHEWLDGQIFAMAGGTIEHGALAMAVGSELRVALRDKPCRVLGSDVRVRVLATGLGTYPDVTVVCGRVETDPEDANTIVNPVLLVEVLSDSTEPYDRGEKFAHYDRARGGRALRADRDGARARPGSGRRRWRGRWRGRGRGGAARARRALGVRWHDRHPATHRRGARGLLGPRGARDGAHGRAGRARRDAAWRRVPRARSIAVALLPHRERLRRRLCGRGRARGPRDLAGEPRPRAEHRRRARPRRDVGRHLRPDRGLGDAARRGDERRALLALRAGARRALVRVR